VKLEAEGKAPGQENEDDKDEPETKTTKPVGKK